MCISFLSTLLWVCILFAEWVGLLYSDVYLRIDWVRDLYLELLSVMPSDLLWWNPGQYIYMYGRMQELDMGFRYSPLIKKNPETTKT